MQRIADIWNSVAQRINITPRHTFLSAINIKAMRIKPIAIICLNALNPCAKIPNITYKSKDINLFVENLLTNSTKQIETKTEIIKNNMRISNPVEVSIKFRVSKHRPYSNHCA